jgi:hypothetical protein
MVVLAQINAPKLTNLTLIHNPLADRGFIDGIVRNGLVGRLRTLKVEQCNLTA